MMTPKVTSAARRTILNTAREKKNAAAAMIIKNAPIVAAVGSVEFTSHPNALNPEMPATMYHMV